MNYLMRGPEEYLKHQFIKKLEKSLLDNESRLLNFEIFRAGESEISGILDSLKSPPFLSEHKIVVIKALEQFSSREEKSLLKYLKCPLSSSTLVMLSSVIVPDKFLGELSRFVKVIICNRLKSGELILWIGREFARRKKKISPALANIIREEAGEDLFYLESEIEKIACFAGENSEIERRHVEKSSGKCAHETVFELIDLILNKKLDKLFLKAADLLQREKPHRILGLLAWQFRVAGEKFRHLTQADLKEKLEIILEGDLFMKRGIMPAAFALERVLVRLCK